MIRLFKALKAYWNGIDVYKVISDRNHWRRQYENSVKKCERIKKELRKAQEK